MKKLKQNSIEIHPMTEKPTVDFIYIVDNGTFSPYIYSPLEFKGQGRALGWIPAEFEVIDELTFEEIEIGEHFAADDLDGNRRNWIKVDVHLACSFD